MFLIITKLEKKVRTREGQTKKRTKAREGLGWWGKIQRKKATLREDGSRRAANLLHLGK